MTEIVSLRGYDIPVEALALALRLEAQGFKMRVQEGKLIVGGTGGGAAMSEDEKAAILKWKPHLMALVAWCEAQKEAP